MNLQEILDIIDKDIATFESLHTDNVIDDLITAIIQSNGLAEENVLEKMVARVALNNFLKKPGNLIKMLESKELDSAGECLIAVSRLPWVRKTLLGDLCIEMAYCVTLRHFEYGNELEKGFAALMMQHLLKNFNKSIDNAVIDFREHAYHTLQWREQMDEMDFEQNSFFLLIQIQYAMIPYIKFIFQLYPQLKDDDVIHFCQELETVMETVDIPTQKILNKASMLSYFIIEERIKQYEGETEE